MDVQLKAYRTTYTLTVSNTEEDHIDTEKKLIVVKAVPLVNYDNPKWYLSKLIQPKVRELLVEVTEYEKKNALVR